jgi:hypothetical protein
MRTESFNHREAAGIGQEHTGRIIIKRDQLKDSDPTQAHSSTKCSGSVGNGEGVPPLS